jgi:tribbles homolog 1/2
VGLVLTEGLMLLKCWYVVLQNNVSCSVVRTEIQLSGLEDGVVLSDPADDQMSDKHGCPAYVSPEIIRCTAMFSDKPAGAGGSYSGRAADIWSLGIILYVMLTGRYPFMDVEPMALFARIALGYCTVPTSFSEPVQNLIYGMLRRNPEERLTATDILDHPWFGLIESSETGSATDDDGSISAASGGQAVACDQCVPELVEAYDDVWGDM